MTQSPKIGLRIIKTTIAVFLSLLLFTSESYFACTTAVICLQNTIPSSIQAGKERVLGTFVGGVLGAFFLFAIQKVELHLSNTPLTIVTYFLISLGVLLTIYICNTFSIANVITLAAMVFLSITTINSALNPILYSWDRILQSLGGIGIALFVNRFCNFGHNHNLYD